MLEIFKDCIKTKRIRMQKLRIKYLLNERQLYGEFMKMIFVGVFVFIQFYIHASTGCDVKVKLSERQHNYWEAMTILKAEKLITKKEKGYNLVYSSQPDFVLEVGVDFTDFGPSCSVASWAELKNSQGSIIKKAVFETVNDPFDIDCLFRKAVAMKRLKKAINALPTCEQVKK